MSSENVQGSIAICGIGCRFPGNVVDPESFWNLMIEGRDGIIDVPSDRWDIDRFYDPDPVAAGRMYVRAGGFLQQRIDAFDAAFFGISPREAAHLDPQQRILLEVAWESFEDAGLPVDRIAGTSAGVFIGGFMVDNLLTQLSPLNRNAIGPHSEVGSTLSILANRLSHFFDLRGPSIAMDTACSSSLVAFHLGCQSLWRGECDVALVGGVNVMHRPENLIAMCKGGFLARDGRCKSFDSRGDGYGRGEGAGAVVIKRLQDAKRDEDRIYAIIRATGVNQDGRTDGITVPNPVSQEALVRQVYRAAKIDPADIGYIEAHGTGTSVGDPLEARALGRAIGAYRKQAEPAVVGSVKANIGHLEAAAGIAGVIKSALCLHHGVIPPLANLETPNPAIPFEDLGLRLPQCAEAMVGSPGERYVAINSFGYGGTNAHAILQDYPPAHDRGVKQVIQQNEFVLPFSARSEVALKDLARSYRDTIHVGGEGGLRDICHSAATRRAHLDYRLAAVASSVDDMVSQLDGYIAGEVSPRIFSGRSERAPQKPVFVFTGMGPQWWAMGRELLAQEREFRAAAEACDESFARCAGWSILAELQRDEALSRVTHTEVAQPANFLVQMALVALWRSWGIEPAAIVGHSVGEVTSAFVSGMLTLDEAVTVSYHRSRLQKRAAGQGGMLAVGLSEDEVSPLLRTHRGKVSIAAVNSRKSTVLAGDQNALGDIAREVESRNCFNRYLQVEVPYHSPAMDVLKPELRNALAQLCPREPALPVWSTVTGKQVGREAFGAEYWCDNIREPVRFADAISGLLANGNHLFLEIGPHPVLANAIRECASAAGVTISTVSSLHRDRPERGNMLAGLGQLYVAGASIHWRSSKLWDGTFRRIPRYPWQREAHWKESAAARDDRIGAREHPLLGSRISSPGTIWENDLGGLLLSYLRDHVVDSLVLLPGAAYIEIAFAAHLRLTGRVGAQLESVELHKALVVNPQAWPQIQVTYDQRMEKLSIHGYEPSTHTWVLHAQSRISQIAVPHAPRADLDALRQRCSCPVPTSRHFERMSERGLDYGPAFRGITSLWLSANKEEALGEVQAPEALIGSLGQYSLHPALLDACFQVLLATLTDSVDLDIYVPVEFASIRLYRQPGARVFAHARRTNSPDATIAGDMTITDEAGQVVAELNGIVARAFTNKRQQELSRANGWLYGLTWKRAEIDDSRLVRGRWIVLSGRKPRCPNVLDELANLGPLTIIEERPESPAFAKTLGAALTRHEDEKLAGVVCLWALDAGGDPVGIDRANELLLLIQYFTTQSLDKETCLALITYRAQSPDGHCGEDTLDQAAMIGLLRVAVAEYPDKRFRVIDIDERPETIPALARELAASGNEDDVALRGTSRFLRRLTPQSLTALNETATRTARDRRLRALAAPPGAGEIEFKARVVVCEHRNLAATMPTSDSPVSESILALGEVTRVGEDVRHFEIGDTIAAPITAVQDVIQRSRVGEAVRVPAGARGSMSEEAQALLPIFRDVFHVLSNVAGLRAGEGILIHGASGLTGLAAVQVAKWLGAKVYVSAANSAAQMAVASLGIDAVVTNNLAFLDRLSKQIGEGVGIILSLMPGAIGRSALKLLSSNGRFIEWCEEEGSPRILLDHLKPNQTFTSVALAPLKAQIDGALTDTLEAMCELMAEKPIYWIPVERLQPGHEAVGSRQLAVDADTAFQLRRDGTYLITGGLGGFGLELAKWLVRAGAGHLCLVGRSTKHADATMRDIEELRQSGVRVLLVSADVSSEAEVSRLLDKIAKESAPLVGVFHAAAVLDDGPIDTLKTSQIHTAMMPKAAGAWNLHLLTKDLSLDQFVLFSSISSLVGSPGQASYVAANTFLDTLATYRQARGLPATSINWGALSEVGMAARHRQIAEYLARVGFGLLSPTQALMVLRPVLGSSIAQIGVAVMDWPTLASFYPGWASSPRNQDVVGSLQGRDGRQAAFSLVDGELSAADREALHAQLIEIVSRVLHLHQDKIDPKRSLIALGLDSVLAIELQGQIEAIIGVKISVLELLRGVSIASLLGSLTRLLASSAQQTAQVEVLPAHSLGAKDALAIGDVSSIDAIIARLSDSEVNELLRKNVEPEGAAE